MQAQEYSKKVGLFRSTHALAVPLPLNRRSSFTQR